MHTHTHTHTLSPAEGVCLKGDEPIPLQPCSVLAVGDAVVRVRAVFLKSVQESVSLPHPEVKGAEVGGAGGRGCGESQ